jgi:hypothetical protein
MHLPAPVDLGRLRAALEASWDRSTAYLGAAQDGNPALGQCYPTARVVQQFVPASEIADGEVWTGAHVEHHFWNVIDVDGVLEHIDFTWQQFPAGTTVRSFRVRDRHTLGDSQPTLDRIELLRTRVAAYLARG